MLRRNAKGADNISDCRPVMGYIMSDITGAPLHYGHLCLHLLGNKTIISCLLWAKKKIYRPLVLWTT